MLVFLTEDHTVNRMPVFLTESHNISRMLVFLTEIAPLVIFLIYRTIDHFLDLWHDWSFAWSSQLV